MIDKKKKEYLDLYLLQQAKIERLKILMQANPEQKRQYKKEIVKSQELKKKIEKAVDSVDGGVLSEVLGQKYLCGRTLEETAVILNYSKRQIERLHTQAIENFKIN